MFTIRALLGNRELGLRLLVAGESQALDTHVVWVHNTELLDPSPYVRPRELLLSNGLWRTTPAQSEVFVNHAVRAHAAGLVFGLRDEVRRTPEDLIDACRRHGLPLLEIQPEVPFTAVSQAAADLNADHRQRSLLGMVRRGNVLADTLAAGGGPSGVLKVLNRDHDLPLVLIDRVGAILASTHVNLDAANREAVAKALLQRPIPLELRLDGIGPATVFLVGVPGELDAALLCLREAGKLSRAESDALNQAVHYLSLEVSKRQAVQAVELRFASEIIDMILSGARQVGEVRSRLRSFGVDGDGSLAVYAIALAEQEAPPVLTGSAETVNSFFLGEGMPALVAPSSQDLVAIVPWRHPPEILPHIGRRLATSVARATGDRAVVGIGRLAAGAAQLRRSLVEAREAARVLRRRGHGPDVILFSELGAHRLLLATQDQETLHRFVEDLLAPLRRHDQARNGELELTLLTFLENNGQWASTADALHVHVNTLRNRLNRIRELTGRDVNETEGRVDLYLALEADHLDGLS